MGPRALAAFLTMTTVTALAALYGLVTGFEPVLAPVGVLALVAVSLLPFLGRPPVDPDKWGPQ